MLVCLYSFHIHVLEAFELDAFRLSFYFVLKYSDTSANEDNSFWNHIR